MRAKLRFVYTRHQPAYTPEETAKLDAARIQVFGKDPDGLYGFRGGPGIRGYDPNDKRTAAELEEAHRLACEETAKHNRELQAKLDSVYVIAGVMQKTCEVETHEIEVDLPAFPSDGHHIMPVVEMRGVGGPFDGLLLDRVNW